MIPWWKVKREFGRLGQQLRAIPELFWEPFAQRAHDRAFEAGLPCREGRAPLQSKVAIVLIYQPKGISRSLFTLFGHLNTAGYTVLVVSNAPVSAPDAAQLAANVWRVVERPNFGYDFGGYRDGIRMLWRWNIRPERLVVLNDSIWFPLWPQDRTLETMEASGFDIAGTVLREREDLRFLESYFFSIAGTVLDHPAFVAFWQNLRLTSNKYKVIRRGERGFGVAMQAAGLSMGGLFTPVEFIAGMTKATDAELALALRYGASPDAKTRRDMVALAETPDADDWRVRAIRCLHAALDKGQFYSSFPLPVAASMGYPVLKKSDEPISAEWRAAFQRAVTDGALAVPEPSVWAEIRGRNAEAGQE